MTAAARSLENLRKRNSFRWRVSVGVGVLAATMVMLITSIAGTLLTRSIRLSTDDNLRATATHYLAEHYDELAESTSQSTQGAAANLVADNNEKTLGLIRAQVLGANGEVIVGDLPVSDNARAVARGSATEWFEQSKIDDCTIRILTVPLEGQPGALQIGLDITGTNDSLTRSRLVSIFTAIVGGLITTVIAALMGSHLVAPITAMAEAVDRISRNDELPERLEGEGDNELGRLVRSFNQMLEDVRHSRSQQRRLVADASHELRTPLTRLRLKIEFVHSQPNLPKADRQRLVEGAVSDLGQLGDLVSELLELAAEGTSAEQSQPLQLANIVSAEVERFRATSGRSVDLSTTPGLVQTRPRQVSRALTNLLVNADKYSPTGYPISVIQRGCRIEVRDQGPGIPPDERERVFDRFYRGSGHHSVDGSGLGLAIVESVARVSGGTTWIRDPSDGGPGAVVGFSIGPAQSAIRRSSPSSSLRPLSGQRR